MDCQGWRPRGARACSHRAKQIAALEANLGSDVGRGRMSEWVIDLPAEDAELLLESFQQGPVLEIRDGKGLRFLTEETMARLGKVKIQVFSKEHPPPHFRVQYQSSIANYTIANCSRLNGDGEVLKYEKNIRLWWSENKAKIIETWNRLRPSDCPVGVYVESSGSEG
jgi:hypothetical protein